MSNAKTIVANGASAGLGLEAIRQLVASDSAYRIIIGARKTPEASLVSELDGLKKNSATTVEFRTLDLASWSSIDAFAAGVESEGLVIDILLLCAGMVPGRRETLKLPPSVGGEDERALVTNALSQAYFVEKLLSRLADDARVAVVSSAAHVRAAKRGITPENVEIAFSAGEWSSMGAYGNSKLVQLHFSYILADFFTSETAKTPEKKRTIVSLHPGFVPDTSIARESGAIVKVLMQNVLSLMPFATSLKQGGATIVQAMTDPKLPQGAYVSKSGVGEPAGPLKDETLRASWKAWYAGKGVWSH